MWKRKTNWASDSMNAHRYLLVLVWNTKDHLTESFALLVCEMGFIEASSRLVACTLIKYKYAEKGVSSCRCLMERELMRNRNLIKIFNCIVRWFHNDVDLDLDLTLKNLQSKSIYSRVGIEIGLPGLSSSSVKNSPHLKEASNSIFEIPNVVYWPCTV